MVTPDAASVLVASFAADMVGLEWRADWATHASGSQVLLVERRSQVNVVGLQCADNA